jgi:hypothetical protein
MYCRFGRGEFKEAQKIAQLNILLDRIFGQKDVPSTHNNDGVNGDAVDNGTIVDSIVWSDMRFLVFDIPALQYQHQAYEDRYHMLVSCFGQVSMSPVLISSDINTFTFIDIIDKS